jgi:ABC-2 type transport system permease protein
MPIFDQGYQHWNGKLTGHAWRWLTITRQGVRAQMKSRGTWQALVSGLAPALVLAGALILWGLHEKNSSLVAPFLQMINLPGDVAASPRQYRQTVWTIAYEYFFNAEIVIAMIITLLVGPGLISQDLRFNALPLYFSRPLRRIDYFAGKLGVIAFFLALVAIVPSLIAYLLGVGFCLDLSTMRDTLRVFGASLVFGLVVVFSAGTMVLAISSLTRNSRYVAAIWFGFWLLSNVIGGIMVETVRKDWCHLISYSSNLKNIGDGLLDTPRAWQQIAKLTEAAPAVNPHMMMAPPGSRQPPPPPRQPRRQREREVPKPPWHWSAGILVGLFGISAWILNSRVKSMDRLR